LRTTLRVPLASRVLFYGMPDLMVFNYSGGLAKAMNIRSRTKSAIGVFNKIMSDGLVENKVLLYVKPPNQDHWIPYFKSDLSVPDWGVPGESKGYATAQKLLSLGYVYNQPKDY
jgi:hypothetical protein